MKKQKTLLVAASLCVMATAGVVMANKAASAELFQAEVVTQDIFFARETGAEFTKAEDGVYVTGSKTVGGAPMYLVNNTGGLRSIDVEKTKVIAALPGFDAYSDEAAEFPVYETVIASDMAGTPAEFQCINSITVSFAGSMTCAFGIAYSMNGTDYSYINATCGGGQDYTVTAVAGAKYIKILNSYYYPEYDAFWPVDYSRTLRTVSVNYSCNPQGRTLTGLTVEGAKTDFFVGDEFAATGLITTAVYSDGSTAVVTPTSISTPDMSTEGDKTVTVTYSDGHDTKTAEYTIHVSKPGGTSKFIGAFYQGKSSSNRTLTLNADGTGEYHFATKPFNSTTLNHYYANIVWEDKGSTLEFTLVSTEATQSNFGSYNLFASVTPGAKNTATTEGDDAFSIQFYTSKGATGSTYTLTRVVE